LIVSGTSIGKLRKWKENYEINIIWCKRKSLRALSLEIYCCSFVSVFQVVIKVKKGRREVCGSVKGFMSWE
jgi:hypothetical protein